MYSSLEPRTLKNVVIVNNWDKYFSMFCLCQLRCNNKLFVLYFCIFLGRRIGLSRHVTSVKQNEFFKECSVYGKNDFWCLLKCLCLKQFMLYKSVLIHFYKGTFMLKTTFVNTSCSITHQTCLHCIDSS